jgi:hypothetical protein
MTVVAAAVVLAVLAPVEPAIAAHSGIVRESTLTGVLAFVLGLVLTWAALAFTRRRGRR